MSDNDTPLDKAVELFVYAPIGLAMFAKDTVPTFLKMFVSRGQTEVTQRRKTAESQAGQYKTVGKFAVKYGGPEVKRSAGAAAETVRKRAEDTLAGLAAATVPPAEPAPRAAAPTVANGTRASGPSLAPTEPAPAADELAIPDYDLLAASQVIERLDGLARPDLLAIQAYEIAHRARNTILGKISQLRRVSAPRRGLSRP